MKRWATLIPVLFFLTLTLSAKAQAADEISTTQVNLENSVTAVVSEEVGAFDGDTGIKRQDQQQAFDAADSLDQTWQDQLTDLKTADSNLSLVVDQVTPTDAQHFEFTNPENLAQTISVTAENVDMKDINNTADLGTKSAEAYQYKPKLDLPGSGANTYNGDTMQDFAPVPRKYAGQYYANESQNGFGDQNSYRNALKFSFSEPVSNFGVWVGDVETRTDGQGTPALLRLYDSNLNLISEQVINPNNIHTDGDKNQGICGMLNTTTSLINTTGCGHNTTRYIGFASNMPVVQYMLIIVGDDDAFPGLDENNGNTEHISFMAPSMGFFTLKTTPNFGSNLSLCDGQAPTSSNKDFCLNLSFERDVEWDLSPEDFILSLSSGSVTISAITKNVDGSFKINLQVGEEVDADIANIRLSLKADAAARTGNQLSTNLASNTLNLSYEQPVDPVDPVEPTDLVDPVEEQQNKVEKSGDAKVVAVSVVDLAILNQPPAETNLSLVASVNVGGLADSGQNIYLVVIITLSLMALGFKFRLKFQHS